MRLMHTHARTYTGRLLPRWSDANAEGEWTDAMKEATGYLGQNDGNRKQAKGP